MWKCFLVLLLGVAASSAGKLEILVSEVQQECIKYGKQDQVDSIRTVFTAMENCVGVQLQNAGINKVEAEALNEDNVAAFYRGICSRKSEINKCVIDFEDAIRPCTDLNTGANNKADKQIMTRIIDNFCESNAQKVTDLVKNGGLSCWQEKKAKIIRCLGPSPRFVGNYKFLSNLYSEMCAHYSSLTGCLVPTLSQCSNPSVAEFFSKVHDDLQKCSMVVNPPEPKA